MSNKILRATCNATGVVTVDDSVVPEAEVLSAGKQASEGLLFIEQDEATYIPSSATDIESTIEKIQDVIDNLNDSLNQLVVVITEIAAGMTGPTTAPPPTLAVDLAVFTAKVVALTAVKAELTALKGALK